jgi:transposase
LKEKGTRFYFLPPYSPELNRIELLWLLISAQNFPGSWGKQR